MTVSKQQIRARYSAARNNSDPVVITPEAARLLRGMLAFTPQRLSDLSSVKKKNLMRFEKDGRALSARDKSWLQATFETAGAEIFMGQGKLYVRLNGEDLISYGVAKSMFTDKLPLGEDCSDARWARDWSQRDAWQVSGVPRTRISAIENHHPRNFHLVHQVALKKAFKANKALADRRGYAPY